MSGKIFYINVLIRTILISLTGLLLVFFVSYFDREILFTLIVGVALILFQIYLLTIYVNKINKTLIQFIESVDSDTTADFSLSNTDRLFTELRKSLNLIQNRVRLGRMEIEKLLLIQEIIPQDLLNYHPIK